jgi:hypothetical protein
MPRLILVALLTTKSLEPCSSSITIANADELADEPTDLE